MRISDSELLDLYDRCAQIFPANRALVLVEFCDDGLTPDMAQALPLGSRDARLLAIRRHLFGDDIQGLASCPKCTDAAEITLNVRDILEGWQEPGFNTTVCVRWLEDLRFRLPTAGDMAKLQTSDFEAERDALLFLLAQCLIQPDIERIERTLALVRALPQDVLEKIDSAMEEADPLASIRLALVCPTCGTEWTETLDVLDFLWSEIQAWASRLVSEIHTIAAAYGWTESEILGLSATRRQGYIEAIWDDAPSR